MGENIRKTIIHVIFGLGLSLCAFAETPPKISLPEWVISPLSTAIQGVNIQASNSNVTLAFYDNRLFMAWRTAPTSFPSPEAELYIVSTTDYGRNWSFEGKVAIWSDVRMPSLVVLENKLYMYFAEVEATPWRFLPLRTWQMERISAGVWSQPAKILREGDVPWEIKERGGKIWLSGYRGKRYSIGEAKLSVLFRSSVDGINFTAPRASVYEGGISEASFEFTKEGDLVTITNNAEGDGTGFGSNIGLSKSTDLFSWDFSNRTDPQRYESPKSFRHGDEIYVVAGRNLDGAFDKELTWLPRWMQKIYYNLRYEFTPKKTALYRVNRTKQKLDWIQDLPSAGDNGYASILKIDENRFILANHSSPLLLEDKSLFLGQISEGGTGIYFINLDFGVR